MLNVFSHDDDRSVYNLVMSLSIKELIAEADHCVVCGLCLPHCPTYRKTGSEADSPRGRIQLMRAVAHDILPNNDRFKEHLDLCLSCRSCESACPNNVNYGALIDASRTLYVQKKSIGMMIAKPFIRHRTLANLLTWPLWLMQQVKLTSLLKRVFPIAKQLPEIKAPITWKAFYPTGENLKGSVSLFLGCASNAFDNQTLVASIYVLNKLGFNVHIPQTQTCCGSIARQAGDMTEAQKLITDNAASFAADIPILTTASGCGAGLKDYLLTHNIQDISAFLVASDWADIKMLPLKETIYVHDPCTLRNVLKSQASVYDLLNKIPHADIQALPGNSQCCGGAGAYVITNPVMANSLRHDKLAAIKTHHVAILATSNIGCSLHIAKGLRDDHLNVQVMHPIHIIAKQMGFSM